MSSHRIFAIFMLVINAVAATVSSTSDQQALTNFPVDFTVELNVTRLTGATQYNNFTSNFRSELAKGGTISGNVPILPQYGDYPHLFDVILTTSNNRVTVRGRRDNLYVRGYLMETNQWMEFREGDGLHMVDTASKFLDFGGSYLELERQAGVGVTGITYSQRELSDAVETLARPTDEKVQEEVKKRGKSLTIMAQMLSEAARFVQVSAHFANNIVNGIKVPEWMEELQKNWLKHSKAVQCYEAYPNYVFEKVTINGVVYNTTDQLRSIFGIMMKEKDILDPKTCGIKNLQDEDHEGEAVVLTADI